MQKPDSPATLTIAFQGKTYQFQAGSTVKDPEVVVHYLQQEIDKASEKVPEALRMSTPLPLLSAALNIARHCLELEDTHLGAIEDLTRTFTSLNARIDESVPKTREVHSSRIPESGPADSPTKAPRPWSRTEARPPFPPRLPEKTRTCRKPHVLWPEPKPPPNRRLPLKRRWNRQRTPPLRPRKADRPPLLPFA